METNAEKTQRHMKALEDAANAWFYGYNWERTDQEKLINAVAYFEWFIGEQAKKLDEEGK